MGRTYTIVCLSLVAGLVVAASIVRAMTYTTRAQPRCTSSTQQLSRVWNAEPRDRVKTAVKDRWPAVSLRIDTYADDWIRAHHAACWARDESRLACLAARREELAVLVLLLSRGDAAQVARSVELTTNLAPAHQCR